MSSFFYEDTLESMGSEGTVIPINNIGPVLAAFLLSPPPAAPLPAPISAVENVAAQAEDALRHGERALAESRYRDTLLEGWMLVGDLDVADGRIEEARAAYTAASTAATELRRPRHSLAAVLLQLGDNAEAVKVMSDEVSHNRRDPETHRLLAQALIASGHPEQAVADLEEAHQALPQDFELAYALAGGYLRVDKPEAAERLFVELEKARPIPETYVLVGRTYRDYHQFERAEATLRKALELDPHVLRAHYYLGTTLGMSVPPRFDQAIAEFEAELTLEPDHTLSHLYLGMALAEGHRCEEALPHLKKGAEWSASGGASHAGEGDALFFIGRCDLSLDRPQEALDVLRRALELTKANPPDEAQLMSIHYQLGLALRRTGAEQEALPHFAEAEKHAAQRSATARENLTSYLSGSLSRGGTEAAKPPAVSPLSPLSPDERAALRSRANADLARAYMNMGILHAQARRFARAAAELEQAAAIDPQFPQVQYSLGVAYFNAGQFEKAGPPLASVLAATPSDLAVRRMLALALFNTDAYDRTVDLLKNDPERATDPSLQYTYAVALVRSGRSADAEQTFSRLLRAHGDQPDLLVLQGQAQVEQGDYDGAVESLQRALRQKPDVADANAALGMIYLKQGRLPEAERALRAEIEAHPDNIRSRHHLAVVLDLLDRPKDALEQLRRVLAARPSFGEARYLIGKVLLALGSPDEAIVHLEAAVRLTPDKAAGYFQLAQAYRKVGRTEEADKQLEVYRRLKEQAREVKP